MKKKKGDLVEITSLFLVGSLIGVDTYCLERLTELNLYSSLGAIGAITYTLILNNKTKTERLINGLSVYAGQLISYYTVLEQFKDF